MAEQCRAPRPFLLPLIPFGVSYHHEDFPGTLSVRNRTLADFVYDVGMGLARSGIKKLIIINGPEPPEKDALQKMRKLCAVIRRNWPMVMPA